MRNHATIFTFTFKMCLKNSQTPKFWLFCDFGDWPFVDYYNKYWALQFELKFI